MSNRDFQRDYYDVHFNRRASAVRDQQAHPLFRSFNDRLAGEILDAAGVAISSTVRVFEPGCGEGLVGAALERVAAARGLGLAYTGADLSRSALDVARTSVAGEFLAGDAAETAAALAPGSQDVVVAKNLLHHLDDPARFLRAAAAALAPGGRVVAFEPRLGCPQFLLFNVLAARRERHYFRGQGRNATAFEAAGLEVVDRRRFSWLPYELAFVIRPGLFRRMFGTANPTVIRKVSGADDRLAAILPWMACYEVWVASAAPSSRVAGTNSV